MHAIALAVFLLQQEQTHFVNEAGKTVVYDCMRTERAAKLRILIVLVMFLSLKENLFYTEASKCHRLGDLSRYFISTSRLNIHILSTCKDIYLTMST